MKKLFVLISIPFILTGCFSSSDEKTTFSDNKKNYDGGSFIIQIPFDWEVIESGDFTSEFPAQTQVAFLNNIQHEIYTANANVTIRAVLEGTSTADFAKNMFKNARNSLLLFEEIGKNGKIVMYGENEISAMVYEFQGKKSVSDSVVRFKELYLVSGERGIVFTTSHLPDENENVVNQLGEMLDSFALK